MRGNNTNGIPDSVGVKCRVKGVVYGNDLRGGPGPNGLLFTIIDGNTGISVYSFLDTLGYTVQEGDEVEVQGTVGHFNGLAYMESLDTIILLNGGMPPAPPKPATVVTSLGENTESDLVRLENVMLAFPTQWQTSGSFNVDVTTGGTDTIRVRIDGNNGFGGLTTPTGMFNITGIGGQFDNGSAPLDSGYQLLPRRPSDIDSTFSAPADLVITEIFFNNPGPEAFEFIEIYNKSDQPINMGGYSFTQGITHTFANMTVPAKHFVLVAADIDTVLSLFGFPVNTQFIEWTSGALSNGGEDIVLVDANGVTVDSIDYNNALFTIADGGGASLVLCDPNLSNADALNAATTNWTAAVVPTGDTLSGSAIFATPGSLECDPNPIVPGFPFYTIATIRGNNTNGIPDSNGVTARVRGVVHGVDMRGGTGVQFTIIDQTGGIGVFSSPAEFGYTVTEGDLVEIRGTVGHFRGLAQMGNVDTIIHLALNEPLQTPDTVTALNESTESDLIKILNLTLVDPAQWTGTGSGFDVDVTDGTNTYLMRIDNDVDLYSLPAPVGAFNLTGIGGQFSSPNAIPYDNGYQILPRYQQDIEFLTMPPTPTVPLYTIATIRGANTNGIPDSNGVTARVRGVVHGVDMRGGTGIQFTIIDQTGGIGVFSPSAEFGYTVTEGDSVEVQGTVGHFRGLAQIGSLDTVILISANQALQTPDVVTALNESTESDLIKILNLTLVDPAQWTGTGSGFDVDVTDGTNTYLMRIDNDVDLYSLPAPVGAFNLTGIGGQFSSPNAIPYDNGYQILPRYQQDIELIMTADMTAPVAINAAATTATTVEVFFDEMVLNNATDSSATTIANYTGLPGTITGITLNAAGTVATLTLSTPLIMGITYNLSVTGIADTAGNKMTATYTLPIIFGTPVIPLYDIATIRGSNTNGLPDSLNVEVRVRGVVHGVDMRGGTGIQFTIIDNTGGIGVFSPSAEFGYTVTEGDSVEVQGTVGHFRGLAQVSNLDTVFKVVPATQALQTPDVVTALNESTESDLIKILNLTLVDPAQWTGTGSGFDVDVTDGTNTYLMRIDNDVDLYSLPAPVGAFNLTGIGGQFSSPNAIPYDNGYQILPRYQQDIELIMTADTTAPVAINAAATTATTVEVFFDEMVLNNATDSSATTIANYTGLPGTITGITLNAAGTVATLTLSTPLIMGISL